MQKSKSALDILFLSLHILNALYFITRVLTSTASYEIAYALFIPFSLISIIGSIKKSYIIEIWGNGLTSGMCISMYFISSFFHNTIILNNASYLLAIQFFLIARSISLYEYTKVIEIKQRNFARWIIPLFYVGIASFLPLVTDGSLNIDKSIIFIVIILLILAFHFAFKNKTISETRCIMGIFLLLILKVMNGFLTSESMYQISSYFMFISLLVVLGNRFVWLQHRMK